VVGGGISGVALAYELVKTGFVVLSPKHQSIGQVLPILGNLP
jgi:glycine/D-amino acid oxidase-like deaminating enzyme